MRSIELDISKLMEVKEFEQAIEGTINDMNAEGGVGKLDKEDILDNLKKGKELGQVGNLIISKIKISLDENLCKIVINQVYNQNKIDLKSYTYDGNISLRDNMNRMKGSGMIESIAQLHKQIVKDDYIQCDYPKFYNAAGDGSRKKGEENQLIANKVMKRLEDNGMIIKS